MLRILLFIYIFLFYCSHSIAQRMEARSVNRDLLVGMGNAVKYTIKLRYDSVNFTTSQGSCMKEGEAVILIPDRPDEDTLYAKFYLKGRIIHTDTAVFDVIKPNVFAAIGGQRYKKISSPVLKAMGGFVFYITVNDYHWEPVKIVSYRFSIVRNGNIVFSKVESSNRYSAELKELLSLVQTGDLVLISEIKLTDELVSIANALPGVFELE